PLARNIRATRSHRSSSAHALVHSASATYGRRLPVPAPLCSAPFALQAPRASPTIAAAARPRVATMSHRKQTARWIMTAQSPIMAQERRSAHPRATSRGWGGGGGVFRGIVDGPPLKLPGDARLVFWTIVNYEVWDIARPMPRQVLPAPTGAPLLPDVPHWSWHEYGMRVGA